jgi:signal peptidase I
MPEVAETITGRHGLMPESRPAPVAPAAGAIRQTTGAARQTAELLVLLCLGLLLVGTFSAEAYIVPTGSMAPTLLGMHRAYKCPNCHAVFVVGVDDQEQYSEVACPDCGQRGLDGAPSVECGGDRVLVEKFLYQFRRPRRWEVAVFHFPGETSQAYVKRVIGLPGESLRIIDGDVFVNNRIARKSLAEIRATRILVHDSRREGRDPSFSPRWLIQSATREGASRSGWRRQDGRFLHAAVAGTDPPPCDWLAYRHWDPVRSRYGPVCDFYGYNGVEPRQYNQVKDLALAARMRLSDSVRSIALALRSGTDEFVVKIPIAEPGSIELLRNDRRIPLANCRNPFQDKAVTQKDIEVEAAVFDRRVQVAIDGRLIFDPYDYDDLGPKRLGSENPVALGVVGGSVEVSDLRIYRDVYYTSSLLNTPRHPHGMFSTVRMGADDYFVLGDNSPVSNDSRFWAEGPVVKGSMFVGRPFLVHLPGEVVPLKVLGRLVSWVPDPRRIRYIR